MRPTAAPTLAVAALLGVLVGGSVEPLCAAAGVVVPTVPWSTVLTLVFLAAVVLTLAWTTWRSLRRTTGARPLEPQRAVTLLVLGRACALGGAAILGGYLAFGLGYLGDDGVLPRERLVRGLAAAAAAAAVVAGGLLLERSCQVPGPPDGPEDADRYDDGPDDAAVA
jgi:hypothetical protein